ncbi:MAG TPA: hypothetical protein VEV17_19025 [Bryobacteraceae bacterium]|nr:hypothetical protein [Bryobacteraceae bacterium]
MHNVDTGVTNRTTSNGAGVYLFPSLDLDVFLVLPTFQAHVQLGLHPDVQLESRIDERLEALLFGAQRVLAWRRESRRRSHQ